MADLYGAIISGADYSNADLDGSNMSGATCIGTNFNGASIRACDVTGADLTDSTLIGANLSGSDLSGANLTRANLSGADIRGAVFTGADLTDAIMTGVVGDNFTPSSGAPILTNIEDAVSAAIGGMTSAVGYNYDWNTVNEPDQALCSYPNAVVIVESERCVDDDNGADQQVYTNECDLIITVRGENSAVQYNPNRSINAVHNAALDDLKKLFGNNHHISETCDRIMYRGMEREYKRNGDIMVPGEMRTRWTVYYRQDRLSPTQAG